MCQLLHVSRSGIHTRSKAAIFRFFVFGALASFSGAYLATSSVGGVRLSGLLSFHVVRSFGFCEMGVKKLTTADSETVSGLESRIGSVRMERRT